METINIAGAGIIGLSCAWRLAQRGYRVRVFDAGAAGREASWAGAGMLAPGGEFFERSELATVALRSLRLYPGFVAELREETGAQIDYRPCGATDVAWNDTEAATLTKRAAAQAEFGIPSEACGFGGRPARFYPEDAMVDPRDVTQALVSACRARGVEIREQEPVLRIEPEGRVVTAKGEFEGSATLIAAGAWSSDLYPGITPVIPVRGHLVSWQGAPGALGSILRHGSTYLLQRSSGLIVGGTSKEFVGFRRSVDSEVVDDIQRRAETLYPALSGAPITDAWMGFRPWVEGEALEIGRIAGTRVLTAYGHYRNGILLAPETAERMERMVAGLE